MALGTVKWFTTLRVLASSNRTTEADVFVHYSQIAGDGFRTLEEGQLVQFDPAPKDRRGCFAENVVKVDNYSAFRRCETLEKPHVLMPLRLSRFF